MSPTLLPVQIWQRTLKASISCVGVGLHSGRRTCLTMHPAKPDHGIVFRRTDLGRNLPARFDLVTDTRLATVLADERCASTRVGTVEHLMAALAGAGIDNALIELDGPEVPALDGSAAPYLFLTECAGVLDQSAPRRSIHIRRSVRVCDGSAFAELRPGADGLDIALSIDFPAPAIGRQALSLHITPDTFRREIARARTFTLIQEVERLRAAGLALGGSLDNAVVVDEERVMNPGGLRMPDEFARHKLLDVIGDLALAGAPIVGRLVAHRPSHTLNNRLLRTLFADASAWRMHEPVPVATAA